MARARSRSRRGGPQANPPVCQIMDYGKYKYEAAQRAKESRRKATNVSIKEMKYRPKIGTGDFDTKTKKVERFLVRGPQGEGHDHVPRGGGLASRAGWRSSTGWPRRSATWPRSSRQPGSTVAT